MKFNIYMIAQPGRLEYESLLLVKSLRKFYSGDDIGVYVCTPENSGFWRTNPNMADGEVADKLRDLGCHVVNFKNERFGSRYPHSNKIYALSALPPDEPFVFFDSDHIFFDDIANVRVDFDRPTARRAGFVWPGKQMKCQTRKAWWDALYAKMGVETNGWYQERYGPESELYYPYFNGGCFYYSSAGRFHELYRKAIHEISESTPEVVDSRSLYPWLDQICLPIVMAQLDGDGSVYRTDFAFSQVATHYFFLSNLFLNVNEDILMIAREIITDPEYCSIFAREQSYNHSFLGEGWAEIRAITSKETYNWMNSPVLREKLSEMGLWYK
ncbi:hypothetical protein [Halovulum sp. GXIMD14793]